MSKAVDQRPVVGFYGKIPSVGDFVHRGLTGASIGMIDGWLQRGMALMSPSSQELQDSYMVSPICYFLLPGKVWAEKPVAGLVMPSVDRVGRLFPLVILAPLQAEDFKTNFLPAISSLKCATESALDALHSRLTPDELYARLVGGEGSSLSEDDGFMSFSEVFQEFSSNTEDSLWWHFDKSSGVRVLDFSSMPDEQLFRSLITGL